MQPHLASSDPTHTPRERIIPAVKNSAPPTYPRTLLSLLTSQRGIKTSKPLSAASLLTPRSLPERAINPSSEEARLLGPFSLRRLVNIHQRQFNEQTSRVLPPLEVRVLPGREVVEERGLHVPKTGLETFDPIQGLMKLATSSSSPGPLRRKKNDETSTGTIEAEKENALLGKVGNRSRRWLRRRYRELLADIPSLTVQAHPGSRDPQYNVDWAAPGLALSHEAPRPLRLMTPAEKKWITQIKPLDNRPQTVPARKKTISDHAS